MKKHLPLICIVALLTITTLSNCNKDNNTDHSLAGGITGRYHNSIDNYDIIVNKVNDNTVSITVGGFYNATYNAVTVNTATTFTLNENIYEDNETLIRYYGDGTCSNGNLVVNTFQKTFDKLTQDSSLTGVSFYGVKM